METDAGISKRPASLRGGDHGEVFWLPLGGCLRALTVQIVFGLNWRVP